MRSDATEPKVARYGYSRAAAPFVYLTWAGAAVTMLTCIVVAFSAVWMQIDRLGFQLQATVLASCSLILGGIVLLFFWGLYPSVSLDPDGVVLSFPIGKTRVPWSEIEEVRPPRREGRGSPVLLARKITPFHLIYGLIYGVIYARRLTPAFLLGWPLERREELVREIERHLPAR